MTTEDKVKIRSFKKSVPSLFVRIYNESFAVHSGKLWNMLLKEVATAKTLDGLKVFPGKYMYPMIYQESD